MRRPFNQKKPTSSTTTTAATAIAGVAPPGQNPVSFISQPGECGEAAVTFAPRAARCQGISPALVADWCYLRLNRGPSQSAPESEVRSVPHRAPGSPGHSPGNYLQGKVIKYYRPRGSAEVRALIEGGFQAFNAGRLSEACHIFTDKMLDPEHDTTIGLTVAGALTPAGLGGCVIELMDRGL